MEQHCLRQRSVKLLLALLLWSPVALAQATIVQISDTHIGLSTAPNALQHLQTVVGQINAMSPQPDAVILTGDIGETTSAWTTAKNTLAGLKAVVYFCPGNHDIHTTTIATYRQYFGNDYYSFKINNITFMVIDSQLLGNYDTFNSSADSGQRAAIACCSADRVRQYAGVAGTDKRLFPMKSRCSTCPCFRSRFPAEARILPPILTGPFMTCKMTPISIMNTARKRSMLLTALNIHTMLAGHWHNQRNFTATSGSFTLDLAHGAGGCIRHRDRC